MLRVTLTCQNTVWDLKLLLARRWSLMYECYEIVVSLFFIFPARVSIILKHLPGIRSVFPNCFRHICWYVPLTLQAVESNAYASYMTFEFFLHVTRRFRNCLYGVLQPDNKHIFIYFEVCITMHCVYTSIVNYLICNLNIYVSCFLIFLASTTIWILKMENCFFLACYVALVYNYVLYLIYVFVILLTDLYLNDISL
jgi:hypothetical protein